jgi:hypothetical protein
MAAREETAEIYGIERENPSCELGYSFMICLDIDTVFGYLFSLSYDEPYCINHMKDLVPELGEKSIFYVVVENFESHGFILVSDGRNVTYYGTYGGIPYYIIREMSIYDYICITDLMREPQYYYLLTSGNPEYERPKRSDLKIKEIKIYKVNNKNRLSMSTFKSNIRKLLNDKFQEYEGIDKDISIMKTAIKISDNKY